MKLNRNEVCLLTIKCLLISSPNDYIINVLDSNTLNNFVNYCDENVVETENLSLQNHVGQDDSDVFRTGPSSILVNEVRDDRLNEQLLEFNNNHHSLKSSNITPLPMQNVNMPGRDEINTPTNRTRNSGKPRARPRGRPKIYVSSRGTSRDRDRPRGLGNRL